MAMMQSLRDSTHIIMIILVIAFIALIGLQWGADVTGRGSGSENYVGKVNGEPIPFEGFRFEFDQMINLERQQRGGDIDDFRTRQILNDLWNQRVEYMLLQEQIEGLDVVVTDAELVESIRENPPDFIKQQAIFQTNGQFDRAKYLQALNNPDVQGWEILEAQYKLALPQQRLYERITSVAHVTDTEARNAYIAQNEKVAVKYLFFDPNAFSSEPATASEEEIKKYYEAHQQEYKQDERARIEYLVVPKAPSPEDSARVERQIRDLYAQLRNGGDFEKMARDFSEDPGSASNGGDMGFFKRGEMVAPFEEAAFNTPVGEMAEPVKTQFGWHIIRVEEKKEEEGQVRARHILLRTVIGQQTLKDLRQKAEQALATAQSKDLRAAARSFADTLSVQETGYFTRRGDGFVPRIGYLMGADAFAFDESKGALSPVFESDTGFYILYLADRKPEGIQTLDEVRAQIQNAVIREKRMEKARAEAEKIRKSLAGNNLDGLPESESSKIVLTDPFARQSFIPGVGQDAAFIGAAFRMNQTGQMSDPIRGDRGWYLMQLVERQPINETAYNVEKEALRRQLLDQKKAQLYADWLANLKEKAVIENRLSQFFSF